MPDKETADSSCSTFNIHNCDGKYNSYHYYNNCVGHYYYKFNNNNKFYASFKLHTFTLSQTEIWVAMAEDAFTVHKITDEQRKNVRIKNCN